MPEPVRGTVLVLEDDEGLAQLVRRRLERLGYAVVSATTPDEAMTVLEAGAVELVVLDYRLRGDVSGLDFYRRLQAEGSDIPAILVTGFADEAKVIEAIRAGVRDFVPKTPDFLDYLLPAIERVTSQVRTKRQAAETEAVRRTNEQLQESIAERRRLEEELRLRNEQLIEADRRKDEFLAMLAHELRNPLAAIGNCSKLLRRVTTQTDRDWCQEVIERQAGQLARLIDDLLDISRVARGKVELRKERISLREAVDRATATVRPLLSERSHTLTIALPAGPLRLEADPTRMEQILVNLLTNAAKYTDPGGQITVSARENKHETTITVTDTGVGIAPEMLPRIFDLFAQVDHSLDRAQGGLGIGLTLVRRLAELHGGHVEARSEGLGKGSEFSVRFPRPDDSETVTAKVDASPTLAHQTGACVLVVDDNRDMAIGMASLLQFAGFDARTAHDGTSALKAAYELHPQIILLDIGLPGMDGFEVAARLRSDETCKNTVIVAVSGYGQEADRRRSQEAGFDHHVVKPIDHDALITLLSDIIERKKHVRSNNSPSFAFAFDRPAASENN